MLRDGVRRNLWSIVLSGLGFFFTLLLPVLMMMQRTLQERAELLPYDSQGAQYVWENALQSIGQMLGGQNPAVKLAFIVLAVVCGVASFAYLHARQKVDFYHSLPVSRSRLFANNLLTGILCTVPMYFIMLAVTLACVYAMGFGAAVQWGALGGAILCHIILFLLLYALTALTTILCGNTVITLLLLLWVMFSPALLQMMKAGLFSRFFSTYTETSGMWETAAKLSPAVAYFTLDGTHYLRNFSSGAVGFSALGLLGVYLLAAVLALALGWYLFRIRKSERAGTALAFEPAKLPVKVYMCLTMGVAFGLVFHAVAGGFWFWPGLVIGAVLFHWIIEIIYAFDFRAIFARPIHLAVILAVLVAGMLCLRFDVAGYDRRIPAADKIAAVDLELYTSSDKMFTSPENIAAVYRLAEIGVEMTARHNEDSHEALEQSFGAFESGTSVNVRFRLTSGREMARRYVVPQTEEVLGLFDQIANSEEYKRVKLPLFNFDLTANEDRKPYMELYTNAGGYYAVASVRDAGQIERILETLREETLARSGNDAPVLRLELSTEHLRDRFNSSVGNAYVTEKDVKTLALVKEFTGVTPAPLAADAVDELFLGFYDTSSSGMISVTDRKDMEALLKNAINRDALEIYYSYGSPFNNGVAVADIGDCDVYVTVDGERYRLAYPVGKAPEDVLAKYRPAGSADMAPRTETVVEEYPAKVVAVDLTKEAA